MSEALPNALADKIIQFNICFSELDKSFRLCTSLSNFIEDLNDVEGIISKSLQKVSEIYSN